MRGTLARVEREVKFSGGVLRQHEASLEAAKILARPLFAMLRARSLGPLVKARAFGMTPAEVGCRQGAVLDTSFVVGEFGRADFVYVGLGEFAHTI